ncbi:putative ankyrin repeat protein [Cotonvirus japonicus]|uniref:Ankyrin repeat protein n=1 Tax=Cotonvirus japonicus TaxID=2811091 RepID=A0ABM7NSZ6_9VIRU|nr:putative ankyrin repeat protein [Cotonvirus japonicus]BCS83282.1 putative ankyrin repeat protein [Cotonvirus japonicus]
MLFKVTSFNERHNDYQYADGLNVLNEEFNDDIKQECGPGGLYYTSNPENFYGYGTNLRVVYEPTENPNFRSVKFKNKSRANMLILGEKYSLFDISTYERFGLNIDDNRFILKFAIELKNMQFIEWWYKNGRTFESDSCYIMDLLSENSMIEVLNWCLNSHLENNKDLDYSEKAVDLASKNINIDVLDWWLNAHLKDGIKLRYSDDAIDLAYENTSINVLDWWLNAHLKYGIKLKYSENAIDLASENININVLDWWLNAHLKHGIKLIYSNDTIDLAYEYTSIIVLDWWLNAHLKHGIKLKYSSETIDLASEKANINVLDWWLNAHLKHGIKLKYSDNTIDLASNNANINVLDWWLNAHLKHGIKLKYSNDTIDLASKNTNINVLDWWLNTNLKYGIELKYSYKTIKFMCKKTNSSVLTWWLNSGLKFYCSNHNYGYYNLQRDEILSKIFRKDKKNIINIIYSQALYESCVIGDNELLMYWLSLAFKSKYITKNISNYLEIPTLRRNLMMEIKSRKIE